MEKALDWLRTLPVAHRGLHDDARPENTLGAFEAAATAGYAIELDVHLTADGQLVVTHDADTGRVSDRKLHVRRTTLAELTALQITGTPYAIPSLAEVFATVAGRVPILIEAKAGAHPAAVGTALVREIAAYAGPVAVQSFDPRIVRWLTDNAPDVVRGQLSGRFSGERIPVLGALLRRSIALNAQSAPDFVAFDVDAMPSAFVDFWVQGDRPLLFWTVRTERQLTVARAHGANVIFELLRPAIHR